VQVSKQFRKDLDRKDFEGWKSKQGQLVVKFGPWVPQPVVPPLAPKLVAAVAELVEETEPPKQLPRICKLVKMAHDAASARDEILGI
jgi:hypothetical protein